jgi:GNAT superfamily N-acetyltransferase
VTAIIRVPALGGTHYVAFAIHAHAALLDEGYADPTVVMVGPDTRAIIAFYDAHHPLGIITYSYFEQRREINVGIGYVSPTHRKQGIYRAMWNVLVETAKELKADRIYGTVKVGNQKMLRVANALNRHQESINIVYEVAPNPTRIEYSRSFKLEDLELSTRTLNSLRAEGVTTLGDVADLTVEEFLRIPNVGRNALNELRIDLAAQGLRFNGERDVC